MFKKKRFHPGNLSTLENFVSATCSACLRRRMNVVKPLDMDSMDILSGCHKESAGKTNNSILKNLRVFRIDNFLS